MYRSPCELKNTACVLHYLLASLILILILILFCCLQQNKMSQAQQRQSAPSQGQAATSTMIGSTATLTTPGGPSLDHRTIAEDNVNRDNELRDRRAAMELSQRASRLEAQGAPANVR